MCGCLVAIVAMFSPRLAVFLLWLFTDRMSIAFDSFWWGFFGWIFLPWTTLAWAVAYAPVRGVTGFGCSQQRAEEKPALRSRSSVAPGAAKFHIAVSPSK